LPSFILCGLVNVTHGATCCTTGMAVVCRRSRPTSGSYRRRSWRSRRSGCEFHLANDLAWVNLLRRRDPRAWCWARSVDNSRLIPLGCDCVRRRRDIRLSERAARGECSSGCARQVACRICSGRRSPPCCSHAPIFGQDLRGGMVASVARASNVTDAIQGALRSPRQSRRTTGRELSFDH
jgi:hypothetical protein